MVVTLIILAACTQGDLIAGLAPDVPSVEDVTQITITAERSSIETNEVVRIRAIGHTDSGLELTPSMDWTADGGAIAPISSDQIYFSSTTAGAFKVVGRGRNKHQPVDTVIVLVTEPTYPIVSITVAPDPASVVAGSSQTFVATGLRSDGSRTSPSVTWSATGGAISSGGVYTAGGGTGSFQVTATTAEGLTDAAAVNVTSGPVQGSHEPPGYVRFLEHDFRSLPNGTSGLGNIDGNWSIYDPHGNLSIVDIGNGGSALQFRFPIGLVPGNDDGVFEGWDVQTNGAPTEYREIYESAWVRIPTADFESNLVGVKFLGYWGVGKGSEGGINSPAQLANMCYAENLTGTTIISDWTLSMTEQDIQDRAMRPNRNLWKRFSAGQWQHYEFHAVLNTLGSANGILRFWIDGVLTHEYTDVIWVTPANSHGFWGRNWRPTWGGGGGTPKARVDYFQVDHLYMSGIRL